MPRTPRSDGPPSLADVARTAGVAPITASRVATGSTAVRAGTRDRVLAAMEELGYRPHAGARALATGRFRTLGIVTLALDSWGPARTVTSVVRAADARGYATVLEIAHGSELHEVREAIARLRIRSVDGIIVTVETPIGDRRRLDAAPGLPEVVVDAGSTTGSAVVDHDQAGGARQAVRHLLELGHATVHHVAGPTASAAASARRRAWRAELRREGALAHEPVVGDWTSGSGYAAGQRLAADPSVTAIFAANDLMALGVIRAFHEAGRRVPREVSVVGFDDIDGADAFWPPLTTVRQRFDLLGERAVDALLAQLDGSASPPRSVIPTTLVVRASTAGPGSGG